MAIFEKHGYCPGCSAFGEYPIGKQSPLAKKILEILDHREQLMVYEPGDRSWLDERPSIVDVMLGGDGTLGMELAVMLMMATPAPSPEAMGYDCLRKIRLVDVVNPYQLGADVYFDFDANKDEAHRDADWSFYVNNHVIFNDPIRHLDNRTIIFDERYAVIMKDEAEGDIELRILKIPYVYATKKPQN